MKKIILGVTLLTASATTLASDECLYASKPIKQGEIVISNADIAHLCVYSEELDLPVFATLDNDFSHLLSDDQKLFLKVATLKPASN